MKLEYLNAMEEALLSSLSLRSAAYAVVGSHAVLCHSPPERPNGMLRTIGDLDVLVDTTHANLVKISSALLSLGIHLSAMQLEEMFQASIVPNLTHGYSAQLLPTITGVSTEAVLQSARMAITPNIGKVPVIERIALMEAKKAAGRPKDLEDLFALEAANGSAA